MSQNGYWVNIKNTILVRNMKKPEEFSGAQWATIKHVLDVMAGFSNDDGTNIYPKLKIIQNYTGLSKRCVARSLSCLLKQNILTKKKHYCLNIPLIESLSGVSQAQICAIQTSDIYTGDHKAHEGVHKALSETEKVPNRHHEVSNSHPLLNKQLTNTLEKTTTTEVVVLVEKLTSEGFLEKEASQQLLEYDTDRINRNYLAFTTRKSKINNPVAWLKDAFKNDWAKSNLNALEGHQGDSPPSQHNPKPKTPTIEELTAYWLRSPPEKRQIIYDEAKVVFTYLDYQLYGADPLSDEFTSHHAFLSMWSALHRTEYRKPKSNGILPSTLEPL